MSSERCPKCGSARVAPNPFRKSGYVNYECFSSKTPEGRLIESGRCMHNQLAAYRALLVEAHELLAEWAIGWPGTRHVADLRTRIEAVVGKEGDGE